MNAGHPALTPGDGDCAASKTSRRIVPGRDNHPYHVASPGERVGEGQHPGRYRALGLQPPRGHEHRPIPEAQLVREPAYSIEVDAGVSYCRLRSNISV